MLALLKSHGLSLLHWHAVPYAFCILLQVIRLLADELLLFRLSLRSLQLIVQTLHLCQVLLLQVLLRLRVSVLS